MAGRNPQPPSNLPPLPPWLTRTLTCPRPPTHPRRMVHDTDIIELELKSKKFSLAVRKKEALEVPEPVIQVRAPCCVGERACAHM